MSINLIPQAVFPYDTSNLQMVPLSLCQQPAEGLRCIPMAFDFSQTHQAYTVNFPPTSTGSVIKKAQSVVVDTTDCDNTITVLFPDTGYRVVTPPGTIRMVPVVSNAQPPAFIVINDDIDFFSGTPNTDIFRLFVLNQFIPEFNNDVFTAVKNYGLSYNQVLVNNANPPTTQYPPAIIDETLAITNGLFNCTLDETAFEATAFQANQFWIDSLIINCVGFDATGQTPTFFIFDDVSVIYTCQFVIPAGSFPGADIPIRQWSNVRYKSQLNINNSFRGLRFKIAGFGTATFHMDIAVFGGILVPFTP
jgi:hypothetical protein